ncbi:hypothetical protein DRQ53_15550, partial [bacterium]
MVYHQVAKPAPPKKYTMTTMDKNILDIMKRKETTPMDVSQNPSATDQGSRSGLRGWELDAAVGHPRARTTLAAPMKLGLNRHSWMVPGPSLKLPWMNAEGDGGPLYVHPRWAERAEEVRKEIPYRQIRKLFPHAGASVVPMSELLFPDENNYGAERFAGASMLATIQQLGVNITTAMEWLKTWHERSDAERDQHGQRVFRGQWKGILHAVELMRYWLQVAAGVQIMARMADADALNEVYCPPPMEFNEYLDLGQVLAVSLHLDGTGALTPDPIEDDLAVQYEDRVRIFEQQREEVIYPFHDRGLEKGWDKNLYVMDRNPLASGSYYHPLVAGAEEGAEYQNINILWENELEAKRSRLVVQEDPKFITLGRAKKLLPRYRMWAPPEDSKPRPKIQMNLPINHGPHPQSKEGEAAVSTNASASAGGAPAEIMDVTPDLSAVVGGVAAASSLPSGARQTERPERGIRGHRTSSQGSNSRQRREARRSQERKERELQARIVAESAKLQEYNPPPLPPALCMAMDNHVRKGSSFLHPNLYLGPLAIAQLRSQHHVDGNAPQEVAQALGTVIPWNLQAATTVYMDIGRRERAVYPELYRTLLKMATNLTSSLWDYTLQLFRAHGWTVLHKQFWSTWAREHRDFGDFRSYNPEGQKLVLEAFIIALFHFFLVPIRIRQQIVVVAWGRVTHYQRGWNMAQEILFLLASFIQYGHMEQALKDFSEAEKLDLEQKCIEVEGLTANFMRDLKLKGEYHLSAREKGE